MNLNSRLPDFLIIGAMKAGTTSLHDYLGKHPDIHTSSPKEIHYFLDSKYNNKSLDWYKSHFSTNKKVSGTSPQEYTKCHTHNCKNVPKRIYKHIPNIKLIYLVREPIKRIISHYTEALEGGYAPKEGLNKFLQNYKTNHYVLTSLYYYQISQYLKYFKKEQILIIKNEDLLYNRLKTLNEIFRFLDVQEILDSSVFDYKKNIGDTKKRKTKIGKFFFSHKTAVIRRVLPKKLKSYLKRSNIIKNVSFSNITNETIDKKLENDIKTFLKKDLIELEKFTGKNFSDWYKTNNSND